MKKYWLIGALIAVVFLGLRLPALHLPYHQDEWKAVWSVAQGAEEAGSMFAHPPLTALSFRVDAALFGLDTMRMLPLLFGVISAALLYLVVKRRSDITTGLIAVGLYAVAFYAVLASLMIDTDGAILPTFFLAAVYAYDTARSSLGRTRSVWWGLTAVFVILGCLVKLSFVIVIGVLILDFIIEHRDGVTKKKVGYALLACAGVIVALVIIFLGLRTVYPQFSLTAMIDHARSFVHIGGRNYSQILFESVKALLYLSPLLFMPLIFVTKATFVKTRLYWLYLGLGFVFYYILFDFSRGALDKYLMFSIVPLCAISATIIRDIFAQKVRHTYALLAGIVISLVLFFLQFINNFVPSLYPKSEWLSRVIHLKWNMLMPFNGGSGPMGFYVSFLFIALVFIISAGCVIAAYCRPSWRPGALVIIICLSLTYHLVFAEEYALGRVNGRAADVLAPLLDYARKDASTDQYITYNDTGAYDLAVMSKYAGRFYAVPELEDIHLDRFSTFSGKYLIVDMPRIDPNSGYATFFRSCTMLASSTSENIHGYIYSCHKPQ